MEGEGLAAAMQLASYLHDLTTIKTSYEYECSCLIPTIYQMYLLHLQVSQVPRVEWSTSTNIPALVSDKRILVVPLLILKTDGVKFT